MLQKKIMSVTVILLGITVFSCQKPAYDLARLKGHWYVNEKKAGYLEFLVDGDTMHVCSPKYGELYYGRIEIVGNDLVQYKEDTPNEVRIKGKILGLSADTLTLQYEFLEYCVKLNDTLPVIPIAGCYEGSAKRILELADH